MQVLPKLNTASSLIFFPLQGLGTQFLVIRQPLYYANNMCSSKIPWRTLHFLTKSMDFVPSILSQYSLIDNEVYDFLEVNILLKVNMRIEKCEEGTEWTEQGRKHTVTFILFSFFYFFSFSFPIILRPYLIVHFFTFYLVGGVVKNDI